MNVQEHVRQHIQLCLLFSLLVLYSIARHDTTHMANVANKWWNILAKHQYRSLYAESGSVWHLK